MLYHLTFAFISGSLFACSISYTLHTGVHVRGIVRHYTLTNKPPPNLRKTLRDLVRHREVRRRGYFKDHRTIVALIESSQGADTPAGPDDTRRLLQDHGAIISADDGFWIDPSRCDEIIDFVEGRSDTLSAPNTKAALARLRDQ